MSGGRNQAVERQAKDLLSQILAGRRATFQTTDESFRHDVVVRLKQLLAGDILPRYEDPDD